MPHKMNIQNIMELREYISLLLVLSFFIVHNIYMVFAGIILAIYSINKKVSYDDKKGENIEKEETKINKTIEDNQLRIEKDNEVSNLSLVDAIEELGFIPSSEKDEKIIEHN